MTFATLSPEAALEVDLQAAARGIAGRWATASWPSLRRLKVEATQDSIRLIGNVTTFFEKQQAYHWAKRLAPDALVEDEINVISLRHR